MKPKIEKVEETLDAMASAVDRIVALGPPHLTDEIHNEAVTVLRELSSAVETGHALAIRMAHKKAKRVLEKIESIARIADAKPKGKSN